MIEKPTSTTSFAAHHRAALGWQFDQIDGYMNRSASIGAVLPNFFYCILYFGVLFENLADFSLG